jgi:hypothetical protein
MADSELTDFIQKRLANRYGVEAEDAPQDEAATSTATEESVVTEVAPESSGQEVAAATEVTPEETPVQSPLKQVLAKVNVSADQYSDEELEKQLVNVFAERDEQRRQMAELQAQLDQMRRQQEQYQLPAQQPVTQQPVAQESQESSEQRLRRWHKVDINQDLVRYCEYDEKTSKFLPDPKYGIDGQSAAKALNDAVAEQQRRSQLMVNDPVSAMQEAGLMDEIEQKIEARLQEYNQKLAKTLTERQQQAMAVRQQQQQEDEFQKFYTDHKSEFFRVDQSGNLMIGLDGKEVPTDRGLLYSAKVREICQELGVNEPDLRVWKLAYKMLPPVEPEKSQEQITAEKKQQAEVKKNQFVEQARKQPEVKKTQIANAFVQPVEQSPNRKLSFREMLERDPDNAEVLGTHYKGN